MGISPESFVALFQAIRRAIVAIGAARLWLSRVWPALSLPSSSTSGAQGHDAASLTKISGSIRLRGFRLNLDFNVEHRSETLSPLPRSATRALDRRRRGDKVESKGTRS